MHIAKISRKVLTSASRTWVPRKRYGTARFCHRVRKGRCVFVCLFVFMELCGVAHTYALLAHAEELRATLHAEGGGKGAGSSAHALTARQQAISKALVHNLADAVLYEAVA